MERCVWRDNSQWCSGGIQQWFSDFPFWQCKIQIEKNPEPPAFQANVLVPPQSTFTARWCVWCAAPRTWTVRRLRGLESARGASDVLFRRIPCRGLRIWVWFRFGFFQLSCHQCSWVVFLLGGTRSKGGVRLHKIHSPKRGGFCLNMNIPWPGMVTDPEEFGLSWHRLWTRYFEVLWTCLQPALSTSSPVRWTGVTIT